MNTESLMRAHDKFVGWCRHKEAVLAAVQQDGDALQYASEELKADKEVMLAAVQQAGQSLLFASEELQAAAVRLEGAQG